MCLRRPPPLSGVVADWLTGDVFDWKGTTDYNRRYDFKRYCWNMSSSVRLTRRKARRNRSGIP
jgi:hypothetical protein